MSKIKSSNVLEIVDSINDITHNYAAFANNEAWGELVRLCDKHSIGLSDIDKMANIFESLAEFMENQEAN